MAPSVLQERTLRHDVIQAHKEVIHVRDCPFLMYQAQL